MSILIVHSLHKLRKADYILEQIWKMGAVLSPLLSTIRHQFKTPQYPDMLKDRWNKLEHLKWLCTNDNNGTFVTEQHTLLQRTITQTENKILKLFFSY